MTPDEQYRLSHGVQATATTLSYVALRSSNPYKAFRTRVRTNAPSPAVTFYNSGERIELSFKSLENWVAKTSNFLVDELEVSDAETFYLDMPAHWLKVVWLLAIWATGCRVVSSRTDASHTVSSEPGVGDDIYCSLQVMGRLPDAPPGYIDFITEVRKFDDFFNPTAAATQIDFAEIWEVPRYSRILIVGTDFSPEQIAAAFESESSLVILIDPDERSKAKIIRDEKVTCSWE